MSSLFDDSIEPYKRNELRNILLENPGLFYETMKNGFSLLEIVVVLSIIFIILGIAIPSERIFLTNAKVDTLRLQLQRAINLTRSEAIIRGEIVTLCGSSNKNTCTGSWDTGYIILANAKPIYVFYNAPNQGQLHWRAFPSNEPELQYLPSGMSKAENGTFWYCLPTEKKPRWAIMISQSGRARLVDFEKDNTNQDKSDESVHC